MNKKAESFKKYLEEKKIEVFQIDEHKDEANTVVFRSQLEVNGQMLPTIVVLDDSVFSFIRVFIAPAANSANENSKIYKVLNELTAKYKPFKFYVTEADELILDCSLVTPAEEINGDLIYAMFDILLQNLGEDYKAIMKEIWA